MFILGNLRKKKIIFIYLFIIYKNDQASWNGSSLALMS